METVGLRVKAARSCASLTQSELADRVGVSRNYIAQIEMGRKMPSLDLLTTIAKQTGSSLLDLLREEKIFLEKIRGIVKRDDVERLRSELEGLLFSLQGR